MISAMLTSLWLLIGSYQSASDDGIQIYSFNEETLEFTYVSGVKGVSNPSFLTVNHDLTRIYAVGEDEGLTATANVISLNSRNGKMKLIDSKLTQGGAPCNICLSPDESMLFTSNYFGGSVSAFQVKKNGKISTVDLHAFTGHSVDPERQTKPYIHAVNFTPNGGYMLVNDLGTDMIHQIPVEPDNDTGGTYVDWEHGRDVFIKAGAGPRHLCFAPDSNHAYLVSELSDEIFTLEYNNHGLSVVQSIKGIDNGAAGSADIHVSPDGKFVYASHRLKDDGISVMKVLADGTLEKVGYQTTGIHPRYFAITPDGRYLLCACRDSNEIQVYERDMLTGQLHDTGKCLKFDRPVCVKVIK